MNKRKKQSQDAAFKANGALQKAHDPITMLLLYEFEYRNPSAGHGWSNGLLHAQCSAMRSAYQRDRSVCLKVSGACTLPPGPYPFPDIRDLLARSLMRGVGSLLVGGGLDERV
jgi:hypothetical protein